MAWHRNFWMRQSFGCRSVVSKRSRPIPHAVGTTRRRATTEGPSPCTCARVSKHIASLNATSWCARGSPEHSRRGHGRPQVWHQLVPGPGREHAGRGRHRRQLRARADDAADPGAWRDGEGVVILEGKPLRSEFAIASPPIGNVVSLEEGQPFKAGSLEFEVLHTPGHSPGGVSFRIGDAVFTGDALFAGSVGRSDFRNSDGRALLEGIRTQLLSMPDEIEVYSGHGPSTTIGQERRTNPFLS